MNTCLVCGTALNPELPACSQCGTQIRALYQIVRAAGSRRFLFGHSPPPRQMSVPPKKEWQPPRRRPARKKKAETEPGLVDPPGPTPRPQKSPAKPPQRRDILLQELPLDTKEKGAPFLAMLLDVVLCLGLNALVLEIVLLFSLRDVSHLVQFSLLPLMFVFLGFTVMYFWLFSGLLHKSLGRIIVESIQNRRLRNQR